MPTTDPKPATKSPRNTAGAAPAADAKPAAGSAPAAKRAKATDATPTVKRAKTPVAKSATDAAAPPRKRAPRKPAAKASISDQERRHLIAVAAYYIAERGGFTSGSPRDHWLEAERQIDAMIVAGLPDQAL